MAFLLRSLQVLQHAKPDTKRAGKFKVRLTGDLAQTTAADSLGSATAEFIYYDGTQMVYSGVTATVYDFLMTGGDSIASGTHAWVEFDPLDSKWWVTQSGCAVSDWEPVTPE